MDKIEKDKIINKAMIIILSSQTLPQLTVAVKYAGLAANIISRGDNVRLLIKDISLLERSIGYAQCSIKSHNTNIHEI